MGKKKKNNGFSNTQRTILFCILILLLMLGVWTWGWSVGQSQKLDFSHGSNVFRVGNMLCIQNKDPGI